MNLLIAIPSYNEAGNLSRVIDRVVEFADQILVVDDGSTDHTVELLSDRPQVRFIRHDTNKGYGQSLIDAFAYADTHHFEWVITMDADGQHEASDIPDFIELIRGDQYDLISGSRYIAHHAGNDLPPPERRDINLRITRIINRELGSELKTPLTDAFCGFKAHRTSSMMKLALSETGYAFPLQFWPRVAEHGLRMTELPVRRIYNDLNRTFGNGLDVARKRFEHYLEILNAELIRMNRPTIHESLDTPVSDLLKSGPSVAGTPIAMSGQTLHASTARSAATQPCGSGCGCR